MFERFRASHPFLRSVSSAPMAHAVQAAITGGALAVAAFWVANLDAGQAPAVLPVASGSTSTVVQKTVEPPSEPIIQPLIQDTIFIVGSDAEAESLRMLLAEDAAIRHSLALAAIQDEVLVASTDEEAELLIATLKEGNQVLAALGKPEVRVVNLRTP